ncbi:putative gustatory receptor 28a [Tribolium madens]|uniref:putative gustatory receptor 28a n=1 Tax=Tribolium madens TaxID=41895 RepID=UPI001CF7259A|nr:putative gustatory receptor 28a [Tribolium madens]
MFSKRILKFFKEPNDVYSAIHPLFYMCTFFGLAPYSLVRVENGKKIFKFAWWPLIRNALLVLILLGSLTYHAVFDLKPFKDSDLQQKLRYFEEIFSSLLSCCSVIFGCIFALKVIEIFKNIEEVDVAFRSLAVWVPYKQMYVSILIHLATLVTIVVTLTVNVIFFATFEYGTQVYSFFIMFMTCILPYFINLLMELQYCHYLNILRVRYKLLNEYLETLVQETQTLNGKFKKKENISIIINTVVESWTEAQVKTVASKAKRKSKEIFTSGSKLPKSMLAISDPVFIVDQVAALHIKLTDTAHMINYAFCVQQLLRITVTFISIVTALFLVAINFNKSSSENKSQLDYFFTFWAFSNACEVMAIVWITSETCEEANTCPRILHKIRNNTTNTNLQDTIEIYSLQMYHNRLYFTVCGLFPLDYTLLYTIVAGVTTYLVILIQFNNSDFLLKNSTSTEFDNTTESY